MCGSFWSACFLASRRSKTLIQVKSDDARGSTLVGMATSRSATFSARPAKRCFLLLALFALSVVLLRPMCDAYRVTTAPAAPGQFVNAQHFADESTHHGHSDRCCAS